MKETAPDKIEIGIRNGEEGGGVQVVPKLPLFLFYGSSERRISGTHLFVFRTAAPCATTLNVLTQI